MNLYNQFGEKAKDLLNKHQAEGREASGLIRERVVNARQVQEKRYSDSNGIYCNAQMTSKQLREICKLNEAGQTLLENAMEKFNLSARAYDRILKVARTIADLEPSTKIESEHLAEEIQTKKKYIN